MAYLLGAEIVLIAVAMAIYVGGALWPSSRAWGWWALGGLLAAALTLLFCHGHHPRQPSPPVAAFDHLADFIRWFALGVGGLLTLTTLRPGNVRSQPEYVGSLLLIIVGLMFVAVADELVLLFAGLELISIPTYVVLYLGRHDSLRSESTAKYFYLSVLASALLLYGFSFLYGATGSTNLTEIGRRLANPGADGGLASLSKVALVLIVAGLGFRITAVPFHFYAPDVYQGTSHANAALLSVIPKAAGLVALVRIVVVAMPNMASQGWHVAVALSLVTMTLGNFLALWQDNIRRLMAYSSIAHAGYLLIGLAARLASPGAAADRWDGVAALLFYLAVYSLATIGTFAALAYLGRGGRQIDTVEELAGLTRTRPVIASSLAIFMFSLTGIPPLAGFWGKLAIFGSALGVDAAGGSGARMAFIVLAVVAVLNSAVSGAYYLRIVGVMYFRAPLAEPRGEGGRGAALAAVICAILVVALGLQGRPLVRATDAAGRQVMAAVLQTPAAAEPAPR
jgi:NADH-quinone oxidoreductase subunit N